MSFEGRTWRISGVLAASGSAYESEVWCRLDELQQALKRQDLSLVALTLGPRGVFADVDLFCKERLDLELQAIREAESYATLQRDYQPVRMLAWLVVLLISGAGVFAGLNTMHGAVVGRIRDLATLQTLGFSRRAIVVSLVQEGVVLSAAFRPGASQFSVWASPSVPACSRELRRRCKPLARKSCRHSVCREHALDCRRASLDHGPR